MTYIVIYKKNKKYIYLGPFSISMTPRRNTIVRYSDGWDAWLYPHHDATVMLLITTTTLFSQSTRGMYHPHRDKSFGRWVVGGKDPFGTIADTSNAEGYFVSRISTSNRVQYPSTVKYRIRVSSWMILSSGGCRCLYQV